ncbi:MAG: methyltransferase [Candidatus Thiodiazotropha sp.]|jgi:hypothetical protein
MSRLQRNGFKVTLFLKAIGFSNWLAALPNKLLPPPFRLIQMGSAYWQSRALYTATRFAIADTLGDGEKSSDELADELALKEDHLYRLLRMLTSLGVFEECGHRRFRNNKLSDHLRQDHPQSVRAMVLMHNSPEISRPWFEFLEPAIRTGEIPFELSNGEELFSYMDNHHEFDALFTEAMQAVDALIGTDYLYDFDWGRFERMIDVGGANGSKTVAILQKQPQLSALVFDRPPVVAGAADYWRDKLPSSVLERLAFSGGDMFEAIPPARSDNDLYLFAAIFHGLGRKQAHRVLDNLRVACGKHHPTIVIADMLAQTQDIDPNIASFDMQMLVNTRGRERTLDEWHKLLASSGFALQEIVDVRAFAKLLVVHIN